VNARGQDTKSSRGEKKCSRRYTVRVDRGRVMYGVRGCFSFPRIFLLFALLSACLGFDAPGTHLAPSAAQQPRTALYQFHLTFVLRLPIPHHLGSASQRGTPGHQHHQHYWLRRLPRSLPPSIGIETFRKYFSGPFRTSAFNVHHILHRNNNHVCDLRLRLIIYGLLA
jgi:hypothetical protein